MYILKSALICFLPIVFLKFSNGFPMQETSGLEGSQDVKDAESENAEIPEWLKVATLIKYRIDESDERLKDMAEILNNNSKVLDHVKNILVEMEKHKEKPVICSLPGKKGRSEYHVMAEAETSHFNTETDSGESEGASSTLNGETTLMTAKRTGASRVSKKVDFLRQKIQELLKNLKERKNKRILETEIPPTCQDMFLITGCNRFASSDGICHSEIHWKLCCRSCSQAALLKVND